MYDAYIVAHSLAMFINPHSGCPYAAMESGTTCDARRPSFVPGLTFSPSSHHHHYVPFVVNRSAVMDLHRSRSCATLIQSLYDIFVHSLMLSVHIVLGLPRPLLPFILPSISNRCTPFPLIICQKYWHFLLLIVFNNDLLVFIVCKTSPLVLCSFHDILNILLYSHISKASNLSDVTLVSVHVSAPYKSVDQI